MQTLINVNLNIIFFFNNSLKLKRSKQSSDFKGIKMLRAGLNILMRFRKTFKENFYSTGGTTISIIFLL